MKLRLHNEQLERLRKLCNAKEESECQWLGYAIDLERGKIKDLLTENEHHANAGIQVLTILLSHYSLGKPAERSGELVKFKDLPGGYAYERSFQQRVVQFIAESFGDNPAELVEAAELMKGKKLEFGDASVEVPALEGVPVVFVLWGKTEFPATANVLFDKSASSFLPTEDLGVLAELTASRLVKAKAALRNKKPETLESQPQS